MICEGGKTLPFYKRENWGSTKLTWLRVHGYKVTATLSRDSKYLKTADGENRWSDNIEEIWEVFA